MMLFKCILYNLSLITGFFLLALIHYRRYKADSMQRCFQINAQGKEGARYDR